MAYEWKGIRLKAVSNHTHLLISLSFFCHSNMIELLHLELHTICFALLSLLGLHVLGCLHFGSSITIDNTSEDNEEVDTSPSSISLEGVPDTLKDELATLLQLVESADDTNESRFVLDSIFKIFLDKKREIVGVVEGGIAEDQQEIRYWGGPLESECILAMPTSEDGLVEVLLAKDIANHHLMTLGLLPKPSIDYGNDAMSILGLRNQVFDFLPPEGQQALISAENMLDECPHRPNTHIQETVTKLEARIGLMSKALMLFDKGAKEIIRKEYPELSSQIDTLAVIDQCVEHASAKHQALEADLSCLAKNDKASTQNNFVVLPMNAEEEEVSSTSEAAALPISNCTSKSFDSSPSHICKSICQ